MVIGASFFTLYFKFPSITQFITAIQTVRGKYDSIENHESVNPEFSVAGDVIGILKDESRTGEVSHFQALATAVSGTVGLGNIAGVAVAIALGGPGATFWMILVGVIGMSAKFTAVSYTHLTLPTKRIV